MYQRFNPRPGAAFRAHGCCVGTLVCHTCLHRMLHCVLYGRGERQAQQSRPLDGPAAHGIGPPEQRALLLGISSGRGGMDKPSAARRGSCHSADRSWASVRPTKCYRGKIWGSIAAAMSVLILAGSLGFSYVADAFLRCQQAHRKSANACPISLCLTATAMQFPFPSCSPVHP